MACGHWLVDGNKLVCRLPRGSVTVNAPKKLLLDALRLCDGTRAWAEVLERLGTDWDAGELSRFMLGLASNGVLVEASELWAHQAEIAQLPMATAIAAGADEMAALHRVAQSRLLPGRGVGPPEVAAGASPLASPLAHLLSQRESARTYADQPIAVECLCAILWAAHGVARPGQDGTLAWHRTIASGGNMHSTRWFVAVLRELPAQDAKGQAMPAGLYEARFHTQGGASLQPMGGGDGTQAWRCLRDPRVLRFASALVFPVCDISVPGKKYGNRATLFALIEAGQALQNAQLMAAERGAAGMLRGDTIAHEVLGLLSLADTRPDTSPAARQDLRHWFAAPALVLGAQASAVQRRQQQAENLIKIAPHLRLPGESFAFAAGPAVPGGKGRGTPGAAAPFTASGRSHDPRLALTKAEAEAWERLAWATPRADGGLGGVVAGRIGDVPGALDPRAVVSYSARQHALPGFPFSPFSERHTCLWVPAVDVATGQARAVPAECVHALSALPYRFQKNACTSTSTSGMAAGTSWQDALQRATLELIERDALACAWYGRHAPPAVKPASLPGPSARRIRALVADGFRVAVLELSTAWAPVIAVFAQSDSMPLTLVTAAADFSPEQALEKALDETEGRLAHARHFAPVPPGGADPMREIERRYRSRRTYRQSDFLAASATTLAFGAIGHAACRDWAQLKTRIILDGFSLLAVDLTPDNATVEQGRVPLQVVRALVPGLVPIWFQAGMQPEGMSRLIESAAGATGRRIGRAVIHPFT